MTCVQHPPAVLVYLHGFLSSPNAAKAVTLGSYLSQNNVSIEYLRPSLPDTPDLAIPFLRDFMQNLEDRAKGRTIGLVGSSLGGYYATWLAEAFNCKAVLVNPAVHPHLLWHKYIGLHQNPYSGVKFDITEAHLKTLQSIYQPEIMHPERYLVLLQMGDEVLDARDARRQFCHSSCIIEQGGDHHFQGFARYLPHIISWLNLE